MRDRAPRIQPDLIVNKYVDGVPYLSFVKDLSMSGIALGMSIEPSHRRKSNILVELALEDGLAPIWLNCVEARQISSGGCALAFKNLGGSERRSLKKFLQRYRLDSGSESMRSTVDQSF